MIGAAALAKTWLGALAMMGAQGTILALVAVLLTRGRLRPAWQAAVWLVVLAKFALPWGPAMPWSLSDLIASFGHHHEAAAVLGPPALQPVTPVPHVWLGWLVLAAAWAVGTSVVLARAIASHRRATRAARHATPVADATLLRSLAARMGVRTPALAVGDASIGPHVVGLVRPVIVIPPGLLADRDLLRAALLHELAHVRRRDALARLRQRAATGVFFWSPVGRLASRRLDLAREAACDAWALEACELPRPAYARLLVQMAALRATAPALAMPHALDARVAAVLGPPARPRLGWPLRVAVAGWIVVALGGARTARAADHATCNYTPALGASLYLAHPEADLDGDGTLSRDEACGLQTELRKQVEDNTSKLDVNDEQLLEQSLCCNCDHAEAYSSPDVATCHQAPGVDR